MLNGKKAVTVALSVLLTFSLSACQAGKADNKTHIVFCTYGNDSELSIYKAMVDEFNASYGKEHNIYVDNTPIAVTGYTSYHLDLHGGGKL